MGKRDDRLNTIVSILKESNILSVADLARMLTVSEMTIRRDLDVLCKNNTISFMHGVAIYNNNADKAVTGNKNYDLSHERVYHLNEKQLIGQKAVSLIKPNDVIIIDTGTTTEYISKYIPDDFPLTVLCYNMNTLIDLNNKSEIKIILAGGYYHRNTQMFQSPEGVKLVERTCADKAFISAAGINNRLIVTCADQYEIETKRSAMNSAMEKILVVDSTKFDMVKPASFANIREFNTIITDSGISKDWIKVIEDLGIKLYIA